MKEIQLTQGQVALVDDEDFESLNQFKWCAHKHGNTFYAVRSIYANGKQSIYMHGAIMGGKGVDHIDGCGLNNQKSNLRLCTQSQNNMNRNKQGNTSSVYKGVYFSKRDKKWMARIKINRKFIYLGLYNTEVEAAKAYNTKAIELFCEFANLNIIP